jgi:hypothetical protein
VEVGAQRREVKAEVKAEVGELGFLSCKCSLVSDLA